MQRSRVGAGRTNKDDRRRGEKNVLPRLPSSAVCEKSDD